MEKIRYEKINDDGLIKFTYAGHIFTLHLEDPAPVSADDDAGVVLFPTKAILDVDEAEEILIMDEDKTLEKLCGRCAAEAGRSFFVEVDEDSCPSCQKMIAEG